MPATVTSAAGPSQAASKRKAANTPRTPASSNTALWSTPRPRGIAAGSSIGSSR